jgi:hypothetical protein
MGPARLTVCGAFSLEHAMVDAVLPASFSLVAGLGGALAMSGALQANQSITVVYGESEAPPTPTAVTFRAAGTPFTGLGATTIDVPWSGNTGDLVLLAVTVRGAGTTDTPAGWSTVSSFTTSFYRTDIFSRIKQAGDTGNITVTTNATGAQTTIGQTFAFADGATVSVGTTYLATASVFEIGPIPGVIVGVGSCVVVIGGRSNDWTAIDSLAGDGLTWQQIGNASTTAGGDAGQVADCATNDTAGSVAVSSKTWTTNELGGPKGGVMVTVLPP